MSCSCTVETIAFNHSCISDLRLSTFSPQHTDSCHWSIFSVETQFDTPERPKPVMTNDLTWWAQLQCQCTEARWNDWHQRLYGHAEMRSHPLGMGHYHTGGRVRLGIATEGIAQGMIHFNEDTSKWEEFPWHLCWEDAIGLKAIWKKSQTWSVNYL